jgi:hypothetical protein
LTRAVSLPWSFLLWMAGGPSQIDTWDVKPDRPLQNRGPIGVIRTKLPGVLISEHFPLQAAMLDRFTIILTYIDGSGRPQPIVDRGQPISELF